MKELSGFCGIVLLDHTGYDRDSFCSLQGGSIFIRHQDLMHPSSESFSFGTLKDITLFFFFFFFFKFSFTTTQRKNQRTRKKNETKEKERLRLCEFKERREKKMKWKGKDKIFLLFKKSLDTFSKVCSFCFKRNEATPQITHSKKNNQKKKKRKEKKKSWNRHSTVTLISTLSHPLPLHGIIVQLFKT